MYTGERILPGSVFNVTYQQSLLAYQFAARLANDKRVLDVACGEGYGIKALARDAASVTGVDKDELTIAEARRRYRQPTVSFIQADLFALPQKLQGQTFDVVCCFQTIEHVVDHDAFIEVLKAVTVPGGKIIVSTPNKRMFPTFNPYHVHEVDSAELRSRFEKHFKQVQLYGVHSDKQVRVYRESKQRIGAVIKGLDILRMRDWLPTPVIQQIYSFVSLHIIKRLSHFLHRKEVAHITTDNFTITQDNLEEALDFIVVATA
ncbi:MAG: class I SAM-dependent methyltransferase [Candidatus Andersenbacteria bacterium]